MLEIRNKENCCGCGACATICQKKCIQMVSDTEGFLYPMIEKTLCVGCGLCEQKCPIVNSFKGKKLAKVEAYAAINKSDKIRRESSSGGIFTLLAEEIIAEKGVVFGTALSKDCRELNHISIERTELLYKLRGSKYFQSNINNTYMDAKKILDIGRKVLFTGTPCQIEGLKAFLGKDYENLFCMDLICHGVPSPKVWRRYLEYVEDREGGQIRQISFRDKKKGWKQSSVLFEFANGNQYTNIFSEDLFMKAFLNDICLRPSCTACKFKKLHRESDITGADFWGVEKILPEMDDNGGTSLLLIHSSKGQGLFEKIEKSIICKKVDKEQALKRNSAATKSVVPNNNREKFFEELEQRRFDELVSQYVKINMGIKEKVRKRIRRFKKSILSYKQNRS